MAMMPSAQASVGQIEAQVQIQIGRPTLTLTGPDTSAASAGIGPFTMTLSQALDYDVTVEMAVEPVGNSSAASYQVSIATDAPVQIAGSPHTFTVN
jgi:hypothetical protein